MSNHSHLSRALEKHSQIECLTLEYLLLTFNQSCACCFGNSQLSRGKQSHFQSSLLLVTVLGLCGSWVLSRLGLMEMACCLLGSAASTLQLNTDSRARGFFLFFSPTAAQSSYVNCEILLSCFEFPQLIFQVNSINQNNSVLTSVSQGGILLKYFRNKRPGITWVSFPAPFLHLNGKTLVCFLLFGWFSSSI